MADDLRTLAKRFNDEVMQQGKVDLVDELLSDDFIEHQVFPGLEPNKEGVKQFVQMFHSAFSDIRVQTLATGVDGDELWVHTTFSGKHTGEFAGIPATGKNVTMEMMDRVRVRDGQVVEHWGLSDDLGMMTQLGVVPEMA